MAEFCVMESSPFSSLSKGCDAILPSDSAEVSLSRVLIFTYSVARGWESACTFYSFEDSIVPSSETMGSYKVSIFNGSFFRILFLLSFEN